MIAWLQGRVIEKLPSQLILDVNGVGYEINISMNTYLTLPEIDQNFACFIQTIVREDSFNLFGFSTKNEKQLFLCLIKVNGVGPKVALGILSSVSVDELITILSEKDSKRLVKLPGIGKKTADRLIIELADKLKETFGVISSEVTPLIEKNIAQDEAIQALVSLGYATKQAEHAINQLKPTAECSADELIRAGLKFLSPAI